jgi:hypothetical protein
LGFLAKTRVNIGGINESNGAILESNSRDIAS